MKRLLTLAVVLSSFALVLSSCEKDKEEPYAKGKFTVNGTEYIVDYVYYSEYEGRYCFEFSPTELSSESIIYPPEYMIEYTVNSEDLGSEVVFGEEESTNAGFYLSYDGKKYSNSTALAQWRYQGVADAVGGTVKVTKKSKDKFRIEVNLEVEGNEVSCVIDGRFRLINISIYDIDE